MELYKIPLNQEAHQELTISFNGRKVRITLRFNSLGNFFALDVYEPVNQIYICQGLSLVCGIPLLMRTTQPYFLICTDESGANLDPMQLSDLNSRCFLYIGEKP